MLPFDTYVNASLIVFLITGLAAFSLWIKYARPLRLAEKRLFKVLGYKGLCKGWYRVQAGWKPEGIFEESDGCELRKLKQSYVDELKASDRSFMIIVRVVLVGFGSSVLAGIIQNLLTKQG